jgi:hypothetical protein
MKRVFGARHATDEGGNSGPLKKTTPAERTRARPPSGPPSSAEAEQGDPDPAGGGVFLAETRGGGLVDLFCGLQQSDMAVRKQGRRADCLEGSGA